jgi:hypothetical protein
MAATEDLEGWESGESENWSRCDTKSGSPLRDTHQGQRLDRGAVTSGAELRAPGIRRW